MYLLLPSGGRPASFHPQCPEKAVYSKNSQGRGWAGWSPVIRAPVRARAGPQWLQFCVVGPGQSRGRGSGELR